MYHEYTIDENYTVRVVSNLNEFRELKEKWNELALKSEFYIPWFCWEWFDLYLRHFEDSSKLLIILLYRNNEISLIAPFVLKKELYKGITNVNKIELMGNAHSTARSIIFNGSVKKEKIDCLSTLFSFFKTVYRDWDIMELNRIPEQNDIFNIFVTAAEAAHIRYKAHSCCSNWYVKGINKSSAEYFASRPEDFLKQIENKKKRLHKVRDWHVKILINEDSLDDYLDLYDGIRDQSWKAPEHGKVFIRSFTKHAAQKGWLRLALLFSGEIPIAAQKWIVCDKGAYIWDLIYDEGYKKYSPGSILSEELFKYVIDRDKVIEIDYLTGDEPYKKFWTPCRRERKEITIFNNSYKGRFFSFLIMSLLPLLEKKQHLKAFKHTLLHANKHSEGKSSS